MKMWMFAGLALFSSSSLAAQSAPPPPVAPSAGSVVPTSALRRLQAWLPGEVRCDGEAITAAMWRRPYLSLVYGDPTPSPVTLRFRIDADGRPMSIAREKPGYVLLGDDIGPSLAAWRFRVSGERRGCSVTYTARVTPLAESPVQDLISYSIDPTSGRLPREGWAAIYPAAATCDDLPRPAPLNQVFPDFGKVAGTPGVRHWTMFAYDLDAKGKPVDIRVLTGTANRLLDAAGAAALTRSRYTGGARTGCRFPYRKEAETMPSPIIPAAASFRAGEEPVGCKGSWVSKPPLGYPEAYRKRAIEGWAVIGFDVAPWGATGNVKVLASEPAAEFGDHAATSIRGAKRAASSAGVTGCIDRVRFRIARPGLQPNTEIGS